MTIKFKTESGQIIKGLYLYDVWFGKQVMLGDGTYKIVNFKRKGLIDLLKIKTGEKDMANENQLPSDEKFLILVLNFQTTAMIGMGKIKNPVTNEIKRNLDDAKFSIDMLHMLAAKTKGNLTKDEDAFLQKALTELRINYIDEIKKDEETQKKETEESEEAEKETAGEESKKEEVKGEDDSSESGKDKEE